MNSKNDESSLQNWSLKTCFLWARMMSSKLGTLLVKNDSSIKLPFNPYIVRFEMLKLILIH